MRTIEFRGWSEEQNKWEFGDYSCVWGKHFIGADGVTPNGDEAYYTELVAPESIGQFTGMYDKNGVKIFEGDIVQYVGSIVAEIFWCESRAGFYFKAPVLAGDRQLLKGIAEKKLTVIGNAYEGVKE